MILRAIKKAHPVTYRRSMVGGTFSLLLSVYFCSVYDRLDRLIDNAVINPYTMPTC